MSKMKYFKEKNIGQTPSNRGGNRLQKLQTVTVIVTLLVLILEEDKQHNAVNSVSAKKYMYEGCQSGQELGGYRGDQWRTSGSNCGNMSNRR